MTTSTTSSQIAKNGPQAQPVISAEELRERLLSPFPRITWRGVLIGLVIVVVIVLSWNASKPTVLNRIYGPLDPFIQVADFVRRSFPPTFELASDTEFTLNIFGGTYVLGWPVIIYDVLVTIEMAVIGTLGAVLMSLPLSLLAARNTSPHPIVYRVVRFILNLLRSIPELIYALIFVVAVGLGPFTGVMALAFGSVGSLSRVYAEAIEQIDPNQVAAVRATGASGTQTFIFAVVPQALPLLISYSIVYFESNVRHATILGLVGAGGIGYKLNAYLGFSDYQKVAGTVCILVIAVTVIDRLSGRLRQSLI